MELIDKYMWYQEGPGVRKNQYTSSGVKLLNVANLVEGKIELSTSSRYISEDEANGRYNHFLVDEGDLIIASSGIQVSYFEKKMGIAEKKHLPLCMNTSTIRFKVLDKNITDIRYFMYFLKSNVFKKQIRKLITGSAQLNFGPSHLKKIKIEMPELKKQQEIVKKLDRVKKIIDIRNNQIIELNELIKSQFVEMFGNKKYIKKCLKDLSITKGKYGSGSPAGEYQEGKPRYIRITDINEDGKLNDNITSPKNEENIEKYILKYGDVLFARTGATVGKTYKYSEKDGYCIYAGYCIKFSINLKLINPDYIFAFTKTEEYKRWVKNKQRVVAQPNINAEEYGRELMIPVPPITLQNQFSEIVKQIDKQKFESMIQLKMLEKIYNIINDRRRYV